MRSTRVEFTGSRGTPLAARLDLPDTDVKAYAVFAHCFTCGKDVVAASRIARALAGRGIAVLRFDFTGLGESGGDFGNTDFSSNVTDLVHAANYLRERYRAPAILIGHSLGGAAVLAATHAIPEVRAVVTVAAPADPAHVLRLLVDGGPGTGAEGSARVRLGGRTFRIGGEFLDDLTRQPQAPRIASLGAALLVMHSPSDELVSVDNARRIFDTARHPKSFVAIDGADHLLTDRHDAEFTAGIIAAWASRYGFSERADTTAARTDPGGFVVVTENGDGLFGQTVTTGSHTFAADEPVPVGNDGGPGPYDLLLAGLGACTSMTVRMYAERKQWPLTGITVELRHSRIHAEDCAECETRVGRIERIDRTVRLAGDLSAEQRRRLLEIADKCPVHRTLRDGPEIITVAAPDAR